MPDNFQKQTVLVTGATGYIGRRLTQRLLDSGIFDLRLLVRNKN
jgi:thioester reductase-like protein